MPIINRIPKKPIIWAASMLGALAGTGLLIAPVQADLDPVVLAAEKERVAVIAKVKPAVAAVCFFGGQACGSGVVISEDGYCLTNFHVVQPTGAIMQCGLADGKLYDSVLVGQDKVGDVALVKLLPRQEGEKFAFVKLGDSDLVKAGDWSLAMGNPFGLSVDFTPTVTYGLVSGVNRYQPPEGKGTLEYTDCIQIDTSINPGNSGGPLFNMKGELIGINGRGSFEKRGRVNSGVGYAISINQIKNFLMHMKAGLDTDHATLGAAISTEEEDGDLSRMIVSQILEESDAARRGIKQGDQITSFAGRYLTSTNQYKNVLGIYPKEWRVPIKYRPAGEVRAKETLVRLMGNMDKLVEQPMQGGPPPRPQPGRPAPGPPGANKANASPAKKMFEAKPGFANFYFNKLATTELMKSFQKHGDFTTLNGPWKLEGKIVLSDRDGDCVLTWAEDKDNATEIKLARGQIVDSVKPLDAKAETPKAEMMLPLGSGGMLVALDQYRRLLSQLEKGFNKNADSLPGFIHGGMEPFYPMPTGDKMPESLNTLRINCEVIRTKQGQFESKWFFSQKDGTLLGGEISLYKDEDPCELFFSDYKDVGDRKLPHRIECRFGDKRYAVITARTYTLEKK